MKFLKQWPFWVMVALFLSSIFLAVQDPLGIKTETGFALLWYFLPTVIIWGIVFVKPTLSRSSLSDEATVRSEAIKSVLRHVITSLTAIISLKAAFGLSIPYIDGIFELAKYLLGNSDMVVNAVMTLLSFGTIIWGFFKSGLRFDKIAESNTGGRKLQ
jgi:hypothetical protein